MSETPPTPPPGAAQQVPPRVVNIQYVKDLSFEVPNAPQIYTQLRAAPRVDINLDVQARRLAEGESVFEVTLVISHWGFILSLTGQSVANGEWLRCDPSAPAPERIVWCA